jgi:chemotaxis protein methyltransferase CheR
VTDAAGITRFRELLTRRFGWSFAERDAPLLGVVLAERAALTSMTAREYLDRLVSQRWTAETTALIERLSITETYFFRHSEQFRALHREVLPERIAARSAQRMLRMLSVACSSGEEAYSLAIMGRQEQPDPNWIVSVTGVDANPAMLARAVAGLYSPWALRETSDPIRRRWFQFGPAGYRVVDEARLLVRFRQHNVADPDGELWQPGQYDVIFCRNLLMYLTAGVASALVGRMTGALAPGGCLFLGHTDSLGSAPAGLELRHANDVFFYQRAGSQAPAQRSAPVPPPPSPPVAVPDDDYYGRAMALLHDENFAEALRVVAERPSARPRDRLLHGVLLAQAGRFAEATEMTRRLIDDDGLNADAHHLLGLCLEGQNAADEAVGQYRLAAYLDPVFALARLRLGQLARRRGDDRAAARELEPARDLLAAENDERIILFGGGFGRISLTVLCRSELEACEAWR